MLKPKMIENEKNFCCQNKHMQPIHLAVLDPNLDKKERLLCNLCMESFESEAKTIGLKKIIQIIEDGIQKKLNNLESITSEIIQKLQTCKTNTQELRTHIMIIFDSLTRIIEGWIQNLLTQREQFQQYSFYDELDNFIKNKDIIYDSSLKLINYINASWITKLCNNLNYYNQDKNRLSFKEIKQQIININQLNFSQHKNEITLKLIDQSVKQNEQCNAIAFDQFGSIIVSTQQNDIKVWSFLNGKFKLIKTLQGHTCQIQCLVYSKKQNFFISGSQDKTLRCWQQLNNNDWFCSEPYQQHTDVVMCIILNLNEDLLFSGSFDKSIKVWKVEFNKSKLTFLYSLDKHNNSVLSLSLNQSENQLVSFAQGQNQIIIWEKQRVKDKFEFKYFVKQSIQDCGSKVHFIKENQFIWITGEQQIDKFYVFELKHEVFKENQEKTIQLIANNRTNDEYRFPIIYNKDRNLIVVRHKSYIYIIREINDGKYKIDEQLNCEAYGIYGTITNNGQYLVYWNRKNQAYSTYELLNK
ncbi:unnamed protein product [Paramecium octaurelia]|uniref:Uncharacterized protein n=1 Tax=Paramecium octaurelia TaxID=43137 RepID=A0A8S1XBT6_PAROT|nr:unnamed protein product [Paramecium octaurelia]